MAAAPRAAAQLLGIGQALGAGLAALLRGVVALAEAEGDAAAQQDEANPGCAPHDGRLTRNGRTLPAPAGTARRHIIGACP